MVEQIDASGSQTWNALSRSSSGWNLLNAPRWQSTDAASEHEDVRITSSTLVTPSSPTPCFSGIRTQQSQPAYQAPVAKTQPIDKRRGNIPGFDRLLGSRTTSGILVFSSRAGICENLSNFAGKCFRRKWFLQESDFRMQDPSTHHIVGRVSADI